jgi:hypothetical protein
MERFFKEPDRLSFMRVITLLLGVVDVSTTVFMLFNYYLQVNIPIWYGIAAVFHCLHVFSWTGSMSIGAGVLSIPFGKFLFIVFFIAFFFDMISLFIRILIMFGTLGGWIGPLFGFFTLVLSIIYIAVDVIHIIMSAAVTRTMKIFRQRIFKYIDAKMQSNVRADMLYKISRLLYRSRLILSLLWKLDLIFIGTLLISFAIGFNLSLNFGLLTLLQFPHVFFWVFIRAVCGSPEVHPPDAITVPGFIFLTFAIVLISLGLDAVSNFLRLIVLIRETTNPTIVAVPSSLTNLRLFFGWFAFTLVLLLIIFDILNLTFLYYNSNGLNRYYNRRRIKQWGNFYTISWKMKGGSKGEDYEELVENQSYENTVSEGLRNRQMNNIQQPKYSQQYPPTFIEKPQSQ